MEPVDKEEQKKPYQSPELVVYGDIKKITQAMNASASTLDGGGAPVNKT
jgi:hypothetical protein